MKLFHQAGGTAALNTTARYNKLGLTPLLLSTTEADSNVVWACAGTLSKLRCFVSANTSGLATLTLRKNGADGNQTISIGAGVTGVLEDAVNTDTVDTDDVVCLHSIRTVASVTLSTIGIVFEPTASISYLRHATRSLTQAINLTRFIGLSQQSSTGSATEGPTQLIAQANATLKDLYAIVNSNTNDATSTLISRKNGSNGNLTISVPATTTGTFSDVSNSDSLVATDLVNLQLTTAGTTGSLSINISVGYEAPVTNAQYIGNNTIGVPPLETNYAGIPTVVAFSTTAPANFSFPIQGACVLSNLTINVLGNSMDDASTVNLQINGSDGNQTLSIPGAGTGVFSDVTNTDTVVDLDLINYKVVSGTSGVVLSINKTHLLATYASSSVTKGRTFLGLVA